jgi:hypothetical protein
VLREVVILRHAEDLTLGRCEQVVFKHLESFLRPDQSCNVQCLVELHVCPLQKPGLFVLAPLPTKIGHRVLDLLLKVKVHEARLVESVYFLDLAIPN